MISDSLFIDLISLSEMVLKTVISAMRENVMIV